MIYDQDEVIFSHETDVNLEEKQDDIEGYLHMNNILILDDKDSVADIQTLNAKGSQSKHRDSR